MIGDTMGTDIVAGIEAGLYTVLVLSGVTAPRTSNASLHASLTLDSVADLCR